LGVNIIGHALNNAKIAKPVSAPPWAIVKTPKLVKAHSTLFVHVPAASKKSLFYPKKKKGKRENEMLKPRGNYFNTH